MRRSHPTRNTPKRGLFIEHLERREMLAFFGNYSLAENATVVSSNGAIIEASSWDVLSLQTLPNGGFFHQLLLDGEDIGLDSFRANIDALHRFANGDFLISTTREPTQLFSQYSEPGIGSGAVIAAERQDLLLFQPASLGQDTTGSWSLFLDGSEVGLESAGENIDGVHVLEDGRIVVSTSGSVDALGVTAKDEDLLIFDPQLESWSIHVDGSDVELNSSTEDIDAVSMREPGVFEVSTSGAFSTSGATGVRGDVAALSITAFGENTIGAFDSELAVSAVDVGIGGLNIDAWAATSPPRIGVIGDDNSDEYASESYGYAVGWPEALQQTGRLDFGELGDWGAPRRSGYRYNWASVDADSSLAIAAGQHTGLAAQAQAGEVDFAVVAIGEKDFSLGSTAYDGIYAGAWTISQVQSHIDAIVANIQTIVATLNNSGVAILLSTVGDPGRSPLARQLYPNASGRQLVADAIERVNSRIRVIASGHAIPLIERFDFQLQLSGAHGDAKASVLVGNVPITNAGGVSPTNQYVDNDQELHTIPQALFANVIAQAIQDGYGVRVPILHESEILGLAGLAYGGVETFPLAFSDYITLPQETDTAGPIAQLEIESQSIAVLQFSASLNDSAQGGGRIVAAEYFVDSVGLPGTGLQMTPSDGAFDGAVEEFHGKLTTAVLDSLSLGHHTLMVRGQDEQGNWGPVATVPFQTEKQFFLSTSTSGQVESSDGSTVDFAKQDVLQLDITGDGEFAYSLYFDGSDVGLSRGGEDIDGLHLQHDGSLVLSTRRGGSVATSYVAPGVESGPIITFDRHDLLLFSPDSIGESTSGSWSILFDGGLNGLDSVSENIDAVSLLADGRIIISTSGNFDAGGIVAKDEDLLLFDPSDSTWQMHMDGSDIELQNAVEDLDGATLSLDGETSVFSTLGAFDASGVTGGGNDLFSFDATQTGDETLGSYAANRTLIGADVGLLATSIDGIHQSTRNAYQQPNVILINTDDQRDDSIVFMPEVMSELVASGTRFTNSFVTTPVCCPSRASLLSGQYSHTHGVIHNKTPLGGFQNFNDTQTLATWLDEVGYQTAMFGKYMNGYDGFAQANLDPLNPYIPPGWDHWNGMIGAGYYNYSLNNNGFVQDYGSAPEDYSTDVIANLADDFIRNAEANDDEPFFLYFAPHNPHLPLAPAPRHIGTLDGIALHRPPSFNEADVSDKTNWVQRKLPLLDAEGIAEVDALRQAMIESMLSVDEAVGMMMDTLRELDEIDNTIVIYTSDNGNHWGEHRYDKKGFPWEESIRVPLIVYDGRQPQQQSADAFALNIDLGATILEYAGAQPSSRIEGQSLVPFLQGASTADVPWRSDFVTESHHGRNRPYVSIRAEGWMYAEYEAGDRELYDLTNDPYQLQSLHEDPAYADLMAEFSDRIQEIRGPDRDGPSISNLELIEGGPGEPITLKAVVSDLGFGDSEVRSPEVFINEIGNDGKGLGMLPVDGVYDSFREAVTVTIPLSVWRNLPDGANELFIHGQDVGNFWGDYKSIPFMKEPYERNVEEFEAVFFSLGDFGTLTGSSGESVAHSPHDIIKMTRSATEFEFELYFNGGDVGLDTIDENLSALHVLPSGDVVVSMESSYSLSETYTSPGASSGTVLNGSGGDLLLFTPSSLGNNTTGTWSLWLAGDTIGLDTASESIDALSIQGDSIIVSTSGDARVPGQFAKGNDLLAYDTLAEHWTIFLKGLDVSLGEQSENIEGVFLESQVDALPYVHIAASIDTEQLTTAGQQAARFFPDRLGYVTTGTFDADLSVDRTDYGINSEFTSLFMEQGTAASSLPVLTTSKGRTESLHNSEMPADVNSDQSVTVTDLRHVFNAVQQPAADHNGNMVDVNADGDVSVADLRLVFSALAQSAGPAVPIETDSAPEGEASLAGHAGKLRSRRVQTIEWDPFVNDSADEWWWPWNRE